MYLNVLVFYSVMYIHPNVFVNYGLTLVMLGYVNLNTFRPEAHMFALIIWLGNVNLN